MCAKLIIAVGIKKVIYIDPYPKSKATELFDDITNEDPNKDITKIHFEAFYGISPRRFLFLFKQENRKLNKIDIAHVSRNELTYLKGRNPLNYLIREQCLIEWIGNQFSNKQFRQKNKKLLVKIKKDDKRTQEDLREEYLSELIDHFK